MRCIDAQKLSSSYLDSDLSPERSAAVRGHLRICDSCSAIFASERDLIDAASELPPLDPPDSIWEAVQARIAEEEVKDSQEWPLGRWFRFHWRPIAGVGLATAMAAVLFVARAQSNSSLAAASEDSNPIAVTTLAEAMEASYEQSRTDELAEADRHYIETIASLRQMLEEDRPHWDADEATAVDAQLAEYRKAAIGTRLAIEGNSITVRDRDLLYAGYRSEIDYLQSALAGEFAGEQR